MTVHSRAEWGAAPPKRVGAALSHEPNGVVHDIGGGDPYPHDVAATLHAIQATEMHGEYVDIAYNVGVDVNGDEWILRGDVADGATKGFSGSSFSVLAICNASHPNWRKSQKMIDGIAAALRRAQQRGVLAKDALIDSHHEFDKTVTSSPTDCCGGVRAYITEIRAKTATPNPVPPEDDMPKASDIVSVLVDGGNVWKLRADGDVQSRDPKQYYGGYGTLKPEQKLGDRTFAWGTITKRVDGRSGYTIWANDNSQGYSFGPETKP